MCIHMLLLLLSCLSHVRLCVTPQTEAHQAPPSLGFSRQEHWSGLPFLSPMHESEKWKWSRSVVSNSLRPHGLQPTRLLRPWDFPGKSTGVGCHRHFPYMPPKPKIDWRLGIEERKNKILPNPCYYSCIIIKLCKFILMAYFTGHCAVCTFFPI